MLLKSDTRNGARERATILVLMRQMLSTQPVADPIPHCRDNTNKGRQADIHNAAVKILVNTGVLLQRDGQNGVGIGAQHHEAGLAQREQARKAVASGAAWCSISTLL